MSAPLLSPVDTPIYDDLIIEQLEQNSEDMAACAHRDAEASVGVSTACCRVFIALLCEAHLEQLRGKVRDCSTAICENCGRIDAAPAFYDVYRVVPL